MARAVELITYPVKGCAGVRLRACPLTAAGLRHDRTFMVVTEDGTFRSQRRDPRLAVISPQVSDDGERLALDAPGAPTLRLAVDLSSARCRVELFGVPYQGIDQGDAAARWLSAVLDAPSRLVRVPPEHRRVTDGRTPGTCGYADSGALHLLSAASLTELNRRLAARGEPALPMSRFRPNVVVDGWDEPHREDRLRLLGVGDAQLAYAKPAVRCAVTRVDQRRGRTTGPEPLRTLADYRRAPSGGVTFGVKLSVIRPGTLAVGDELRVTAWAGPED